MKILYVSPEIAPFAKTGGLADVACALPKALREMGHDIRAVMPKYLSVEQSGTDMTYVAPLHIRMYNGLHGGDLWHTDAGGVPTYFIDNQAYFHRDGFYGIGNWDYPDNLERFVYFCNAVLACCQVLDFAPDVIHCNDWQTAALPALLKVNDRNRRLKAFFKYGPKTVFSIHNIAYQGLFPEDHWPILGLPRRNYAYDFEFYNQINLMKSAIIFADVIHTVSETYAREIRSTDLGFGLQGVLQDRQEDLFGILNGVDYQEWHPQIDKHTYGINYSSEALAGKRRIKSRLRDEYHLPERPDVPLIGMTTRFVPQKGIDLVVASAERILQLDTQLIVLGSGTQQYHDFFEWLLSSYPDRVALYIGFNNELAHKIEAGCDMFLMPSLFEPCGLTQIYSLKYGTLPIVRLTGGLADSIRDGENGFTFYDFEAHRFFDAVQRACHVYRNNHELWRKMMTTAMDQDFSWQGPAEKYIAMYRAAFRKK